MAFHKTHHCTQTMFCYLPHTCSSTPWRYTIHSLRLPWLFGAILERRVNPSSHVDPPAVHSSWLICPILLDSWSNRVLQNIDGVGFLGEAVEMLLCLPISKNKSKRTGGITTTHHHIPPTPHPGYTPPSQNSPSPPWAHPQIPSLNIPYHEYSNYS